MKTTPQKYQKCKKPKVSKKPLPQKPRARVKGDGSKVFSFKSKRQALAFFVEVTKNLGLDAMRSTQATADGLWFVAVRGFSS